MRPMPIKGAALFAVLGMVFTLAACTDNSPNNVSPSAQHAKYQTREVTDGKTSFIVVDNPGGGPTLSYGADSGIKLLDVVIDGSTYAFKDMNGNGKLDTWEDWRVDAAKRAADLSAQMSVKQIAGLMLWSGHEGSPGDGLTDPQKKYLSESNLRAVLNAADTSNAQEAVPWVNAMQAYVETLATADNLYVPVNFASDPRSTARSGDYNAAGADISRWPSNLGLAATFDPSYTLQFGEMVSAEYRALGITTALSPQIDLATEPRWLRVGGTFGEDSKQVAQLAAAYVKGFQTTGGNAAWGPESVNAMIKHYPGDGAGEGGREAHTPAGKYAVYPGNNYAEQVSVFKGALDAAAVMTSYSIGLKADGSPLFADRKGSAYDSGKMASLRGDNSYNGVVSTDWGVMEGSKDAHAFLPTAWGAEDVPPAERFYGVLRNGTDMFGNVDDPTSLLEAATLWDKHLAAGDVKVDAKTRFQESGSRILKMFFQVGLYESAFVDPAASAKVLASADKMAAGYKAQLASIVMLKNDGVIAKGAKGDYSSKTVYIPQSYDTGEATVFGPAAYTQGPTLDLDVAAKYFGKVVTDKVVLDADGKVVSYTAPDLSKVDIVLVGMHSPVGGAEFANSGFDTATGTYYPLSLQYRPYTANGDNVRKVSISGDILADGTKENRSYFGKTSKISNEADLDAFKRAVDAVAASGKHIPVVTMLKASNPVIPAEFEPGSNAILVSFGTSDQALIEVALGLFEPSGRLPIQFPANMDTVEKQFEDVPKDMTPYTDAAGHAYDYGFGINYSGPIK